MNPDVLLVLGLLFAALSLPNVIGSFSKGEPPRLAMIFIVISGILIVAASVQKPSGYTGAEIPGVVGSVISDLIN